MELHRLLSRLLSDSRVSTWDSRNILTATEQLRALWKAAAEYPFWMPLYDEFVENGAPVLEQMAVYDQIRQARSPDLRASNVAHALFIATEAPTGRSLQVPMLAFEERQLYPNDASKVFSVDLKNAKLETSFGTCEPPWEADGATNFPYLVLAEARWGNFHGDTMEATRYCYQRIRSERSLFPVDCIDETIVANWLIEAIEPPLAGEENWGDKEILFRKVVSADEAPRRFIVIPRYELALDAIWPNEMSAELLTWAQKSGNEILQISEDVDGTTENLTDFYNDIVDAIKFRKRR